MEDKVLLERMPYRFVEGEERGYIEKFNNETNKWHHMYECDSRLELCTAMEDMNYCRWLDPKGVPCYTQDRIRAPYDNKYL